MIQYPITPQEELKIAQEQQKPIKFSISDFGVGFGSIGNAHPIFLDLASFQTPCSTLSAETACSRSRGTHAMSQRTRTLHHRLP